MILSAQTFDAWDRCERRFAFEQTHSLLTISPLALLYSALEASLTNPDPIPSAKAAIMEKTCHLEIASGDLSPSSSVHHVQAMAEVIGMAIREKLGKAKRVDPVDLGGHEWHSNLFEIKSSFYRLILTSHIDDDSLRSFAHSWQTIGELAVLERPITLLVIIIGAQRGGRRHSHWSKAFQHPLQKSAIRFAPRNRDDGFTKSWKPIWREQSSIAAETWLDQMKMDEVLDDLLITRKVQFSAQDQRMIQAKSDMLEVADRMTTATVDAPMRRSSCDELGRGPCPFSPICYSADLKSPDDFPWLYRPRETPLPEPAG